MKALKTRVIAFVAVAIVLLVALVWWVGDFSFAKRDSILVDFGYTGALQVGAPVRVSGINIGKVAEIRFFAENETPQTLAHPALGQTLPPLVRVRLSVDSSAVARFRNDAQIYVGMNGFIGEAYVEVNPGTGMAAYDKAQVQRGVDAARLHVLMQQASYALEIITKLLQTFLPMDASADDTTGVAGKAGDLFSSLTDLVHSNADNLHALLEQHVALAADLRIVVKRVRDATENGQLQQLLDNGVDVAVVLKRELPHILERVQKDLDDLHALAESLKTSSAQAPEIVGRVNEMTKQMQLTVVDVQAMVHNVRRGDGTIGGFMNDAQIYDDVKELMRDLRRNPWKFFWRD